MDSNYSNEPAVISIVATKSGTGKTTLIEKLVRIFKSRNFKVGILKHNAHNIDIDKEGKDSYRFSQAGADNVIVASSNKLAMIQVLEEEKPVEEILSLFNGIDIVIIEGFKRNNFPKIEVHRKDVDTNLLCKSSDFDISSFIAVASDEKVDTDIPVLNLNDVPAVADFIVKQIL